jgi:rRNA processing protein Krr1/Pno1
MLAIKVKNSSRSSRSARHQKLGSNFILLISLQVEIKTTPKTASPHVLQKAADFVHAFLLGT